MKTQSTLVLSCLLFLGILLTMHAQNRQLKVFTIENGLPQSQVFTMAQDNKGYLWLGTQGGGLVRFDGDNFKVFNDKNGLASNYVNTIISVENKLYLGTKQGLSIKHKTQFLNFELPEINKIVLIDTQIFLLTKKGIYVINSDNLVKKIALHPSGSDLQINDVLSYGDNVWMATTEGLWQFSGSISKPENFKKIEQGNFQALTAHKNKIFASTFNDGTLVFDANTMESGILIREPLRVTSASILNLNELWIATDTNGVSVIDATTNEELFVLDSSNGLSSPNIRQVLQDRQSNIWIATSGGGLYKYFQNNFKHYNTEIGLNGNRIYAVHHDGNSIWISNSEAGLIQIDSSRIQDINLPDGFSEVKIKTITSDQNDNIWAGSDGRGLYFRRNVTVDSFAIDTLTHSKVAISKTIKIEKVFNSENGYPFDWIRKIEIDKDTLYAATYANGIIKFSYNVKLDSLTVHKTFSAREGIKDLNIRAMVKGEDNTLWYATQNGHLGYLQQDKITHLGPVLEVNAPINSIVFRNDTMFLGTAGQGIWWSNADGFTTFKKLKGLKSGVSNNIYQLIFDNQGYLWVGTERGVDKIELDKDTKIKDAFFFGRNDGFLGIETCLNAVDKDEKGHLWFGALYGLTEYQPNSTSLEITEPTIYLEDVKVAFKSIDTIDVLNWANSNRVLHLNPNQNQVSFSFKTVDLDHPNSIEYRCKLNENIWSPWSNATTQDYSELNYGAHQFVVQSRNHRWKMSDPLRFSFFIESPLYKKSWFQGISIGLGLLILIVITRRYVKRIKQKNKQEKERLELENHLLTLEQKALRLQMNPHFIFNVLNGIKAMAPTKIEKMNDTVNSFAILLRETLMNSREDTISLEQEIKTLTHYIKVERLMAEKPFSFDIKVNTDLNPEDVLIPPMLVQPFVENAIRHGILKGPRKGMLTIQFETIDSILKVTISDNGLGIYSSQQQKPQTDHQSMAIKVTSERIQSISGKDALHINEIKHIDGSIGGTNVVFTIPLKTDY